MSQKPLADLSKWRAPWPRQRAYSAHGEGEAIGPEETKTGCHRARYWLLIWVSWWQGLPAFAAIAG
jgi:hypothetical protein